jgi:hypothetical protein
VIESKNVPILDTFVKKISPKQTIIDENVNKMLRGSFFLRPPLVYRKIA